MRDPETFETKLSAAYHRYADEVGTDVDPMALARAIALRPVRTPLFVPRFGPLRLAVLLGLLAVVAIVAAAVVGGQLSPQPAPAAVSNGWIAFSANPEGPDGTTPFGEFDDIYLLGEGAPARRIIGSDQDGHAQGCPKFSPDGSMLAYAEGGSVPMSDWHRGQWPVTDRAVVVVGLDVNGEPSSETTRIDLPSGSGTLPCPEWSPRGTKLAFLTGAEVWVADVPSEDVTPFPIEPTLSEDIARNAMNSQDLEWSPDGSSIAVAEYRQVRLIHIDGTEPTVVPVEVTGDLISMGWTSGGGRIVYITADSGDLHVLDPDGGGDRMLRDDADGANEMHDGSGKVVVSPDGARLAYVQTQPLCDGGECQARSRFAIIDADGSNEIALSDPVPRDAPSPWYLGSGLLWSPDGQRLLYIAYSEGPYALVSVAVTPGSAPVIDPVTEYLYVTDIADVTWQPIPEAVR